MQHCQDCDVMATDVAVVEPYPVFRESNSTNYARMESSYMTKLRAVFALPKSRLELILARDCTRAGTANEISLGEVAVADHDHTHAVGPAQAVMFLIGAVAAEGEAGLVRVEPV